MTTVDRYIAASFLSNYVILLLAGIGVYIFSDLLVNLDEFTEGRALGLTEILGQMADFYGYNLPRYYQQLGGVMLGIAAGFTFALMLRNNELTPLVAAGVPLQRLAAPALLVSVVLVAAWVVNGEVVVPALAHKIARQHGDLADAASGTAVLCVRDDRNAILSARELHVPRGELRGVMIIAASADGAPAELIRADAARYDAGRTTWRLERGARLTMGPAFSDQTLGHVIRWEPVDEYPYTLAPDDIRLRQSAQWTDLMSIRQMNALLRSRNLPNAPAIARTQHVRFVQPLLAWIMMLLIMPFFLTRQPENVLVAGGKALLLAGSCFVLTFLCHSVAADPHTALLAAAAPVLAFGPVAVLFFTNVRT